MNTKIIVWGLVVILAGWGIFAFVQQKANDNAMMEGDGMEVSNEMPVPGMTGDEMMVDDDSMIKDDAMMDDPMTMVKGSYETYSPEKLTLAENDDVLLFFHADWCPICRGLESEIKADLSAIPDGVHILKVDYDTAIALRQKYGVTVQHTFVQVDAQGNLVQKFSTENKLSGVLSRVK